MPRLPARSRSRSEEKCFFRCGVTVCSVILRRVNRISNRALEAFGRLRADADFDAVVADIRREIEHLDVGLMEQRDEVQVRWLQGRKQALSELLFLYDNAGTVLAKRQAQAQKTGAS
jgi:hypothetical protein